MAIIYLTKQLSESPNRDGYEPAEIPVTPQMERAGLEELYEVGLADPAYLVRSIFRAMEYERLGVGR
jgi:hypothetical protein